MNRSAGVNIQVVLIDIDQLDVIDQPMPLQSEVTKEMLMNSIKERDLIDPIVVKDSENGRYRVLEGRTRLELVKKLGYKRIACNLRSKESDAVDDKVLPYELELCRRHLPDSERKRLEKEKDKIESTEKEHVRSYYYRKLSPDMRSLYEKKLEDGELSKEWKSLFYMISNLSMKEQQDFFEKHLQEGGAGNDDMDDIRDTLNKKIDELEKEIKRSRESEAVYKNTIQELKEGFEARAAAAIKRRETELEEKFKDENMNSRKIQAIIAEERKKIEDELGRELKEETRRLKEMSKQHQTLQKELELLKEEKRTHDKKMKELDCILKQKRGEIDKNKAIIDTLANTKNVYRQLEIVHEHLKNVNYAITYLGDVKIDDKTRESMAQRIDNIRDLCQMIDDAIRPESEGKGKDKKAA